MPAIACSIASSDMSDHESVASDEDRQKTRIFVSLENDQSTRYWIPVSAIPTWAEFASILAEIFHNDSEPTLYYVSDRRNIIHSCVWPYRAHLTQNGIFYVEFANEAGRDVEQEEFTQREESGEGVVESPASAEESLPPPPYTPNNELANQEGGVAAIPSTNGNYGSRENGRSLGVPLLPLLDPTSAIFSLQLLIQTPHNPSSSSQIPHFSTTQHLIVGPSFPISYIREIARRFYLKQRADGNLAISNAMVTLLHKKFNPDGSQIFPARLNEMVDGKTLADYDCVNEDSRVEVTIVDNGSSGPHRGTPSSITMEWIRQAIEQGRSRSTLLSGGPDEGRTQGEEYEMEQEGDVEEETQAAEDAAWISPVTGATDSASPGLDWPQVSNRRTELLEGGVGNGDATASYSNSLEGPSSVTGSPTGHASPAAVGHRFV